MLILASASPRRRDLLTQIGVKFTVETADIDETPYPNEYSVTYVKRLAAQKAATVLARYKGELNPQRLIVLGADTTVVYDGMMLGKPADEADAARTLRLLAGRTHQVVTGVALLTANVRLIEAEITEVEMRPLTVEQITYYVATGEPMGKAGAYAIQGFGARFIPRISGCYSNVVGLPLARVSEMLERLPKEVLGADVLRRSTVSI